MNLDSVYDKNRNNKLKELSSHKCKTEMSSQVFRDMLVENANNNLLKRGLTHNFVIDGNNAEIIKQLYLYFTGSEACAWNVHAGIILAGKIGCGKTLLMNSYIEIANKYCGKIIESYQADGLVEYIKKNSLNNLEARPLFIDELGREPGEIKDFGTSVKPIAELIAKRYEKGARTYATTNYGREMFASKYGEYINSRLCEMCNYIMMPGESRRKIN